MALINDIIFELRELQGFTEKYFHPQSTKPKLLQTLASGLEILREEVSDQSLREILHLFYGMGSFSDIVVVAKPGSDFTTSELTDQLLERSRKLFGMIKELLDHNKGIPESEKPTTNN